MPNEKIGDSIDKFEEALQQRTKGKYLLRLYVTGMTPNSIRAIENIKRICKDYLEGRFELEIVDIYKNPELAKESQIIAAPTLIRKLPPPLRRFIGDLSDMEKILVGLDLTPEDAKKEKGNRKPKTEA